MQPRRFDRFVSALGRSSQRRQVLTAFGVVALGLAGNGGAKAKPARRRTAAGHARSARNASAKDICGGACGALCDRRTAIFACEPTNQFCDCVRSVTGTTHCAAVDRPCPATGSADECQRDADCGPNAICAPTDGGLCCRGDGQAQVNLCFEVCPTGDAPATSGKTKPGDGAGMLLDMRGRLPRP